MCMVVYLFVHMYNYSLINQYAYCSILMGMTPPVEDEGGGVLFMDHIIFTHMILLLFLAICRLYFNPNPGQQQLQEGARRQSDKCLEEGRGEEGDINESNY